MASFELSYLHNGLERVAVLYADDYRDAYEACQSLQGGCVIGDEIIEVIHAPEIQAEKREVRNG